MSTPRFAARLGLGWGVVAFTFAAMCVIVVARPAAAQPATWTGAVSTSWNTAGNWSPAGVPNSVGRSVTFDNTGASGFLVNIGTSVTAGSLTFATSSGGSGYTLTSSAGQTLSGVSAISVTGFISGTAHTIDLANVAAGSLLVPGTGPAALTISNGATTGTLSLTIGPNTVIGRTGAGTAGITINGRGHTRISGTIASSINDGLTFNGPGFLNISGTNNGTGATTMGGGTLTLDYGTNASSKLPNGALNSAGGELVMLAHGTTSFVESVSSTSLTAGHLQLSIDTNTGALADLSLTLGAITRSAGSTAQFKTETGGAITTTTGTINGILGGWATADDSNWATKSGANMIPLAAYGNDMYVSATNTNVTTGVGIPSNFTTNSLRFNTDVPGGMTATLNGTNTIQSGGILMGAGSGDVLITGGNIQSGAGGEVIIHQNNPAAELTINSTILAPNGLTKTGAGRLILGGSTTTIDGPINVNRGSIRFTTLSAVSGFEQLNFNDNRTAASQRLEVELPDGVVASQSAPIKLNSGAGGFANVWANNNPNSRVTFSGVISSPAGAITQLRIDSSMDTSRIDLTGTNTFTGDVTLVGGTLGIDADSSLGNAANTLILAVNNTTAGGLEFLGGGANLARPISINASTRVLSPGAFINTISGVISSNNALIKVGTGTLVLTADNSSWSGPLHIDAGTVRVASAANLGGSVDIRIGGRLEITDNLTSARTILLGPAEGGPGPGTFDVAINKTVTLTGLVSNRTTALGALVKAGPGTLVLTNASNSYSGGTTVERGTLQAASNAALGAANGPVTVEPLGTLVFTGSTTTSRPFNLTAGTLTVAAGQTLTFSGATAGGGFLRGPGTFALTGSTSLIGVNTASGVVLNQTGPATVTNFTNNGQFTNAAGQTLTWSNGTNTSAGRLTIAGTANVSEFVSDGTLTINPTGTINNSAAAMVLGGGSTTMLGSGGAPGGTIALGGQSLELRGGLLANFGTISGGTVNVYFGGLAAGSGTFPTVVLHPGGAFTPGVTLANVPAPVPSSSAAILPLDPNQSTATSVLLNADTLATIDTADATLTFTSAIDGPGRTLTKVGGGTLAVAGLRVGGLAVNDGTVRILPNGGTTTLNTLSIASVGRLDLLNNKLIITGGDVAAVTELVKTGYHGGAWDGAGGIVTGAATSSTGLGVARADEVGLGGETFGGVPVAAGDVLVRFTLYGDVDLDGTVGFADLVRLAQNYNQAGKRWPHGDFDYDQSVGFTDLVKLAQNYNSSLPAGAIAGAPLGFEADVAAAFATVPEPAAGAAAMAMLLLAIRRRRVRR